MLGHLPLHRIVQEDNFPTFYRAALETDAGFGRKNVEVAVTMLSHVGNVHAALHTAQCLERLKPHFVLMVGIAGGVKEKVHLGDVVVSEQIIYYEFTKEEPFSSDFRPEVLSANKLLLERAKNYKDNNWYTLIHAERPKSSGSIKQPEVHSGPIASGEKVIANEARVDELKQLHSKLLAIEMESYGVALSAAQTDSGCKFIAIRGISDYADAEKNDTWHEYAAESAAAYSIGLLRSGGISIPNHEVSPIFGTLIAIRHQSMEPLSNGLIEASLPEPSRFAKIVEIKIDQTDLYDNGRLTNPVAATRRQRDFFHRLCEAQELYPDAELGYYGIAHIPLLFHIGCQVLTRVNLHYFEYNRFTNRLDFLPKNGAYPQIKLEGLPDVDNWKRGDAVVRISISYLVRPEFIEDVVTNPIASMHLRIDRPKRDIVTSKNQLEYYSEAFRNMLDGIREKLPNIERVHIFYAGPVALAVKLGSQIRRPIDPRIIVYNYSSKDNPPGYAWGLEVTADVDSPDFLTRIGG